MSRNLEINALRHSQLAFKLVPASQQSNVIFIGLWMNTYFRLNIIIKFQVRYLGFSGNMSVSIFFFSLFFFLKRELLLNFSRPLKDSSSAAWVSLLKFHLSDETYVRQLSDDIAHRLSFWITKIQKKKNVLFYLFNIIFKKKNYFFLINNLYKN